MYGLKGNTVINNKKNREELKLYSNNKIDKILHINLIWW